MIKGMHKLQTLQMFLIFGSVGVYAEDLACAIETVEWQEYYSAYEEAARATALEQSSEKEGRARALARAALAEQLLVRTSNVTDVLSCNVGVIAGYFLLARLVSQEAVDTLGLFGGAREGKTGLAYRLLQMALVFIFTLRNANRIPPGPAKSWGVTEHHIIPAIMHMRHGQDHKRQNDVRRFVPISPSFRDPELKIAIVSICAYPPDHPLALPKLTPPNREAYAERHGYSLRLHLEHPVIGAHGLGVQHAKLATVLAYLQSNKFDWVAWLDCDSIIMNMNKTLDSIIYQHAQKKERQKIAELQHADEDADLPPVCGEVVDDADALIGEWLDSWVTSDFQEESLIRIRRGADTELYAEAPQIGLASGRLVDNQLEMDFDGGTLRAQIIWNTTLNTTRAAQLQWDNGARWLHKDAQGPPAPCREPCRVRGPSCNSDLLDPEVNLLITEEGWGLSSANWLIKHSAWSVKFLHDALTAAHVELQLFGDQDAMILHLMNRSQSLEAAQRPSLEENDPLDRHAAIIPQFELNAYDALNALTMECDAFVEGDFLVTFPQCKDADGCEGLSFITVSSSKKEIIPLTSL